MNGRSGSSAGLKGPIVLSDAIGRDLSAEEGQLMTQHEDLGVLRHRVHPVDANRIVHAVDNAVEETELRGRRASYGPSFPVKAPSE